jgi:alpha-L-rhamnosidase
MFLEAKPVWAKGKSKEMNSFLVLETEWRGRASAELHIAGTCFYRVYVNDVFLCFGPARTAKGYVREDIVSIPGRQEKCHVRIEAVGYYCKGLSTAKQTSCLMAEIRCADTVIASTGKDFKAYISGTKVQKVERYSAQRHFTEIWDYTKRNSEAELEVVDEGWTVLERKAPYPCYEDISVNSIRNRGTYEFDENLPYKKEKYSWQMSEDWGFFPWDEIEHHPFSWAQRLSQTVTGGEEHLPVVITEGEYVLLDFGRVEAGFLKASMEALEDSDVVFSFCEYFQGDTFAFQNMNAHNVLDYMLAKGDCREVQSFEPYTFRFVRVCVKKGKIQLKSFGMKTYVFDTTGVKLLNCENQALNDIYRAAVRTFAHNAVDLYYDCPSRERAGWLCDSYFTAKTEYALTGKTLVEDAFLENYRLYKNEGELPEGMLPRSYPSDHKAHHAFIPQWSMWYILEVAEYIQKRGHEDAREAFRESVYGLLAFYRQYENADGLLEKLPSWNFVEWSVANEWTWDVNYPTNFLYAKVLECIASIYGDAVCLRRSAEVRKAAAAQSFKNGYFRDHAVRDEAGKLQLMEDSSEACQYYAVLFGGLDLSLPQYGFLKHLITDVFTPDRKEEMPEIFPVNMFIGAYLRMEALLQMKEYALVLKDIEGFFGNMEKYTGTLWEYKQHKGSYDHGFASYALVVMETALKHIST